MITFAVIKLQYLMLGLDTNSVKLTLLYETAVQLGTTGL